MADYDVGDRIRLVGNFVDEDGDPANPTAVTCKVRTPAGVVTTLTSGASQVTSTTTGEWAAEVDLTESGVWSWRMVGTGAVRAAEDDQFVVVASVLA